MTDQELKALAEETAAEAEREIQDKLASATGIAIIFNRGALADKILTALRAAAAGKEKEGWLPIETAPKDGTEIWLMEWRGSYAYSTVDFGNWGSWIDDPEVPVYLTGWLSNGGNIEEPTHWMPMPDEPAASLIARAGKGA